MGSGSFCSSKTAAAFSGLRCLLRPRRRALHLCSCGSLIAPPASLQSPPRARKGRNCGSRAPRCSSAFPARPVFWCEDPKRFPSPPGGKSSFIDSPAAPVTGHHPARVVMTRAHQLSDRGRMAFASAVSPEVDTTKTTLVTGTFNPEAKGRMRLKVKC